MRTRPVPVPRRIGLVFQMLAMGIGLLAAGIVTGLFPSVWLLLIGGGVAFLAAAFLLLVAMALLVCLAVAFGPKAPAWVQDRVIYIGPRP